MRQKKKGEGENKKERKTHKKEKNKKKMKKEFKCVRIILRNRNQEFCPLVCNATFFTVIVVTSSNPNIN
jgi:hypothetical protein